MRVSHPRPNPLPHAGEGASRSQSPLPRQRGSSPPTTAATWVVTPSPPGHGGEGWREGETALAPCCARVAIRNDATGSGQRLRLQALELVLRDRARIEQRLRVGDLV